MPAPHRIDTHHHIFPPKYLAEERERILNDAQAVPREQLLAWSPAVAIEAMDAAGTATAIVSVSTPGVCFGNLEQSRRLARVCNEFGAELARDHKGRFGMFAILPLVDIEGSLREIEYALDTLKLDGIGLMTSYGDVWPGNKKFAPIFDELNRRKAIVYFHPTAPTCCTHLVPGIASAVIEFLTDSTRCITDLLYSGTFTRCPDIRWIFSHGGGSLPMLAGRITGAIERPHMKPVKAMLKNGVMHELKKLHYDVASVSSSQISMNALLALAPLTQILFGSDYPFCGIDQFASELRALDLTPTQLKAIERENGVRLFPQYA
jgi:predicted TIM-barrel fold metal-dependent hydrolase